MRQDNDTATDIDNKRRNYHEVRTDVVFEICSRHVHRQTDTVLVTIFHCCRVGEGRRSIKLYHIALELMLSYLSYTSWTHSRLARGENKPSSVCIVRTPN